MWLQMGDGLLGLTAQRESRLHWHAGISQQVRLWPARHAQPVGDFVEVVSQNRRLLAWRQRKNSTSARELREIVLPREHVCRSGIRAGRVPYQWASVKAACASTR